MKKIEKLEQKPTDTTEELLVRACYKINELVQDRNNLHNQTMGEVKRTRAGYSQCNPCFDKYHNECVNERCECPCKPRVHSLTESGEKVWCSHGRFMTRECEECERKDSTTPQNSEWSWEKDFYERFSVEYIGGSARELELVDFISKEKNKSFEEGLAMGNKTKEIAINNIITDSNTARKESRTQTLTEVIGKLSEMKQYSSCLKFEPDICNLCNEVREKNQALSDIKTMVEGLKI